MMKSFLVCLLLVTLSFMGLAQDNPVAIGQWRSHLSYESSKTVTESEEAVFFGTDQAVLKVNKEDMSFEHLNKVIGLSDMGVQVIEYYKGGNVLVIAYDNGNIDLLYDDGTITNLSAIKTNSNIIGNKEIYHIFGQDNKIYFSCSFGLTIYDLELEAFRETVFTQTEVNACTQFNNTLYISTASGIYAGVLDGRNLQDFSVWEFQGQIANTATNGYTSRAIITFDNKIYADYNDTLVVYENNTWKHIEGTADGNPITFWRPSASRSDYVPNFNFAKSYNEDKLIIATFTSEYYTLSGNNEITSFVYSNSWRVKDLVIDQDGIVWAADQAFMHRNGQRFRPNSPKTNIISDLHADEDGALWMSMSLYNTYQAFFTRYGFAKYQDGIWKAYHREEGYTTLDTFYDPVRIIKNSVDGSVYVGSYMEGLLRMDSEENITIYDEYTPESTLSFAIGDGTIRVVGLAVDEDGNTWMANSLTNDPIAVRKRNGDWKSISIAQLGEQKTEYMEFDRNGYLWIKQITGKVVVYDPGNIDDNTDDQSIQLGSNNSMLPTNNINCIKPDKNGVMWVGTDQGITIFNCSRTVFDGGCQGNRPIIEVDSFNGFLLEAENVKDIAVDGANRKWVGTDNGLFLLSEDGEDQLAYFNTENSPLFDNEVKHIEVEGVTGTVYIATGRGLQSFRSDATTGKRRMDRKSVTIYPHPIRPDYSGPIAISNLADESDVKITDISGRLVYETTALGGQAIWDGMDYNGRKAQSGVYLVFIVNEEGTQQAVGKILFIN